MQMFRQSGGSNALRRMFYKRPYKKVGGRFVRGGVKPRLAVCKQVDSAEQISSTPIYSVCGKGYPPVHTGFKPYAEELFFHTSRYYLYTESFLSELAGCHDFSMAGFKASRMSSSQRRVMAGLLNRSPEPRIARAVIQVVQCVLMGRRDVPVDLDFCSPALMQPRPPAGCCSPGLRSGLAICKSPVEPFLNCAKRFRLKVDIDGTTIVISVAHLQRILGAADLKIRTSFEEALRHLICNGYRVADRQTAPQRKYSWD